MPVGYFFNDDGPTPLMYVIKHLPEDFVVVEKSNISLFEKGDYAIFSMKKRNYNTLDALRRISEEVLKPLKDFGFAGNKDRKAVSTQHISLFKGTPALSDIHLLDIDLDFKGYSAKKIALGDLSGNEFSLLIRNLDDFEIAKLKDFEGKNRKEPILIPNYFGPQRFSWANHLIGRELVKKNFSLALELLLSHDREHSSLLSTHHSQNPSDAIGSLRLLPQRTLTMHLHAYQSSLFNTLLFETVSHLPPLAGKDLKLPLIGFGTEDEELPPEISDLMNTLLSKEKLSFRDFINRQMPELSSEGSLRNGYFIAPNFSISEEGEDEHFIGKKKMKIIFTLGKSCYATVLLSFILDGCANILHDRL